MSGHSKWSTIKRKKAAIDAKRGAVFSRVIKDITSAARRGGGDLDGNPQLRLAVAQARGANMPQANIERAIKKGTGELAGAAFEAATYEGYGPGGAAIYMEVLTDNKKRTVADIRHLMTKYGGNLGESGCVAWMFENRATLSLPRGSILEDDLYEVALDYGAEDIQEEGQGYVLTVSPEQVSALQRALEDRGVTISSTEVGFEPTSTVAVTGKDAGRLLKLLDALDEVEDIQKVYCNLDIGEEELAVLMEG